MTHGKGRIKTAVFMFLLVGLQDLMNWGAAGRVDEFSELVAVLFGSKGKASMGVRAGHFGQGSNFTVDLVALVAWRRRRDV